MRYLAVLGLAIVPAIAHADESLEPGTSHGGGPTTNRINMRVGAATSDTTGRPTICLDVRVWSGLGVESCGTGQGVIHDEPGSELAHFRGTWSLLSKTTGTGTGRLRGGIGWAELQVGVDHPGFHFGSPDKDDRGSVAGPEATLQGQWMVPLGAGVEAIASFTAGVAVFASADELIVPKDNVQPFASVELGIGW
ncbi:MAG: hypothetical protein HOV81_27675 [Kofleriaceae bacterium]|nr:hypothetical protein [Kofleriaceae bacterium]